MLITDSGFANQMLAHKKGMRIKEEMKMLRANRMTRNGGWGKEVGELVFEATSYYNSR